MRNLEKLYFIDFELDNNRMNNDACLWFSDIFSLTLTHCAHTTKNTKYKKTVSINYRWRTETLFFTILIPKNSTQKISWLENISILSRWVEGYQRSWKKISIEFLFSKFSRLKRNRKLRNLFFWIYECELMLATLPKKQKFIFNFFFC